MKALAKTAGLTAFTLACIAAGGWIAQQVENAAGMHGNVPLWAQAIGIVLLAFGTALRTWANHAFYRRQYTVISLKPPPGLITDGPFSLSRNPHYLAIVLLIFGYALAVQSVLYAAFAGAAFLAFRLLVTRHEEKALATRFGKQYETYRKRVRRWI